MIRTPTPSVHVDLYAMVPKFRYELRAGELTSLIRIKKIQFPQESKVIFSVSKQ